MRCRVLNLGPALRAEAGRRAEEVRGLAKTDILYIVYGTMLEFLCCWCSRHAREPATRVPSWQAVIIVIKK